MTTFLTALGSIAGIVAAGYGVFKWVTWDAQTTPAQVDADIDKANQDAKHQAEESGRPVV